MYFINDGMCVKRVKKIVQLFVMQTCLILKGTIALQHPKMIRRKYGKYGGFRSFSSTLKKIILRQRTNFFEDLK